MQIAIFGIQFLPMIYLSIKKSTIASLLVWMTFQLTAQQFHGGFTLGLVGSQVAGDNYSGFKKAGIFGGGFVSLDVSDRSALQMELTYFQKGSRENPTEKNNYDYYLFRADYIELPLLYQFKSGKDRNLIIEAGPSIGFLMHYFEEDETEVISDYTTNTPAITSFQFNIGFRWLFLPKFGASFRYNASLFNIRKENVTGDVWRLWGWGQFHDALVLGIYYQFRKKGD